MTARVITATRMGFREQARRPLLLVLLVVLPFFFITRAVASSPIMTVRDSETNAKTPP